MTVSSTRRRTSVTAAVWVVLVVAVVVRLAFVAATEFQAGTALDPLDYERHALSIAHGHGFPDSIVAQSGPSALRPPAYPFALGALYVVTGDDRDAVRLIQLLLLGLATVALIGVVARRLAGPSAALAAMTIAAIYPPLLAFQSTLLTEALAVPLILAAVAAALRFRDDRARRWLVATGVLAGLVVLTRYNAVVLVPLLAAATTGSSPRRLRDRLAAPAAVLAVAALTIAPWTARNALVLGAFVPVSTQTGYTLAGAYNDVSRANPEYAGAWVDPTFFVERLGAGFGGTYADVLGDRTLDEVAQSAALTAAARAYVGDHPGYPPKVLLGNLARALGLTGTGWERLTGPAAGIAPRPAAVSAYGFLVVALLALAGALTAQGRRLPKLVWLGAALLLLSFAVAQGEPRFRLPLDPLLVILAGIAVASVAERLVRFRTLTS